MNTFYLFLLFVLSGLSCQQSKHSPSTKIIESYTVDPKRDRLGLFWKDKSGSKYETFANISEELTAQKHELTFAMNGGMFHKNLNPVGLYIENGKTLSPIDEKQEGYGNFYLQPNGIFYITNENKAAICTTEKFKNQQIKYATQSGPMLVIDNNIHPKFSKGSSNINIRNGVGILPNGQLLFAISTQKINLHDFAVFFKEKGCKNALYLDGFVSKMYLPQRGWNEDGRFGVIIAVQK